MASSSILPWKMREVDLMLARRSRIAPEIPRFCDRGQMINREKQHVNGKCRSTPAVITDQPGRLQLYTAEVFILG
jgi:hypothetical protein